MEREGVKIDPQMLSRLSGDFAQRMLQYEAEAYGLANKEFNLGSPKQLGEFFDEVNFPRRQQNQNRPFCSLMRASSKISPNSTISQRSAQWRQLSKLRSTYTEALQAAVNPETRRVHTTYRSPPAPPAVSRPTIRNLQNIPIRTEEGRRIREAFIAEKGNVLVSADSEIELRLLAHVADIPQLKQAFADGIDIHARTASEMFGVPVEGMPKDIRANAKAINFGIIYGISAFGLANQLGISREEAGAYIKTYFQRFPGIRDYMEATKKLCREQGYVSTILWLKCHYPRIAAANPSERAFNERAAINAPIQGSAADIIRRAMIRMDEALARARLSARMLLQVHDELVFELPEDEVDRTIAVVRAVMIDAPHPAAQISVPLQVDAKAAKNWDEAH